MKKLISILCSLALVTTSFGGTGDIRIVVLNADGTYSEAPLAFIANSALTFGSTAGTITTVPMSNYATVASMPVLRAGTVSLTGSLTKTVTFASPMTNANYVVQVIPNGLATSGYATSKTTTGFTLNLSAIATGNVDYIATPIQ